MISGFSGLCRDEDVQNMLTLELKLIEQKLMGNSNTPSTDFNKVNKNFLNIY